jgi:hypothetical protein
MAMDLAWVKGQRKYLTDMKEPETAFSFLSSVLRTDLVPGEAMPILSFLNG